jgi:hypothetical protein
MQVEQQGDSDFTMMVEGANLTVLYLVCSYLQLGYQSPVPCQGCKDLNGFHAPERFQRNILSAPPHARLPCCFGLIPLLQGSLLTTRAGRTVDSCIQGAERRMVK